MGHLSVPHKLLPPPPKKSCMKPWSSDFKLHVQYSWKFLLDENFAAYNIAIYPCMYPLGCILYGVCMLVALTWDKKLWDKNFAYESLGWNFSPGENFRLYSSREATIKRFMYEIYLCKLCESSSGCINLYITHKFFIVPYVTMHSMLEHIFIKRPILMNLHKFCQTHKNITLWHITMHGGHAHKL